MLKGILQKTKNTSNSTAKCIKCGKRDATRSDGLCDSCRYTQTIESIVQNRK